jgi:hypothetical protein
MSEAVTLLAPADAPERMAHPNLWSWRKSHWRRIGIGNKAGSDGCSTGEPLAHRTTIVTW